MYSSCVGGGGGGGDATRTRGSSGCPPLESVTRLGIAEVEEEDMLKVEIDAAEGL